MTDARVTQRSLEEWAQGTPAAQITQTAAEVWGGVSAASRSAILTQISVEEWARVPLPPVLGMQTAVAINTG